MSTNFFTLTMYTIAHLLMVAGLACDRLSTSKISLMPGASPILSPLARQRTLESSNTVLRFSTHSVSTGPSSTSQRQSVRTPPPWSFSRLPSWSIATSLVVPVLGYVTEKLLHFHYIIKCSLLWFHLEVQLNILYMYIIGIYILFYQSVQI